MQRWAAVAGLLALAVFIPLAQPASRGDAGSVSFGRGQLNFSVSNPTSLAWGPDGRLYVASQSTIVALTLNPATKQVLSTETIAFNETGILGIAFDPGALPMTLYASRQNLSASATDGFEGVVSRFTAPNWTRQDVITGLPSSAPASNHFTNGLAFNAGGQLLIAQGSSTDAGVDTGSFWPETPLSAAILIADVHAPGFNGAITYNPSGSPANDSVNQVSGTDVSVFASGTRNPYDLVVHSNGYVYATDNGAPESAATSLTCSTSNNAASASDELNRIVQGNYYGHPNRNRGRFDADECVYHPAEAGSGAGFTGPIATLPAHCSCDGLAEYTSDAFSGAMQGDLLIAEWGLGRVRRVQLAGDGLSVTSVTTLESGFENPLDVAVGPDGTVYIAEYTGNKVSFLQPPGPDADADGCSDAREQQTAPGSQATGGLRDDNYFWDFFDTPDNNNARDRVVSVADIGRVVARFGSGGSTVIDPLSVPPAAPAYHTAFDRSPATGDPWDLGPPDGSITIGDVGGTVVQFGHTCA
ncbi:MAG: flexitail domain-containing putative surface protein [Dehalococcoidia bacterium]